MSRKKHIGKKGTQSYKIQLSSLKWKGLRLVLDQDYSPKDAFTQVFGTQKRIDFTLDAFRSYVNREKKKLRNLPLSDTRRHGHQLLTDLQEEHLIGIIQSCEHQHRPLKPKKVQQIAGRWAAKPVSWDGTSWYKGFVSRHRSRLSQKTAKALSKDRAQNRKIIEVENFCDTLERVRNHKHYPPHAIYSCDEMPCSVTDVMSSSQRLGVKEKEKLHFLLPRNGFHVSFINFFNAGGIVVLSAYVLPMLKKKKRKRGLSSSGPATHTNEDGVSYEVLDEAGEYRTIDLYFYDPAKAPRGDWKTVYCFTESGFMDVPTYRALALEFVKQHELRYPGIHALLITDQHYSHLDQDTMLALLEQCVEPIFLATATTHWSSVPDNGVLAILIG